MAKPVYRPLADLRPRKLEAAGLLLAGFLLAPRLAAAPGDLLILVDDLGQPLKSSVELCFVEGLGTDCVKHPAEAGPVELPAFGLLRAEGPDYGPVSVRSGNLPAPEDGVRRLPVPRKATLRVRNAESVRLTAALHSTEDLDPTRPAHSLAVPPGGELKVPPGKWLLALESRGAAPDLHELAALPGSTHAILYRPRAGWSLIVRAVAKDDEAPVPGARVAVRAAEPLSGRSRDGETVDEERPSRTLETGADGLALISGLADTVVDAELRHPERVRTTLPGISSSPGTLELREIALGRGAVLEAEIRVDGEAAAGWRCSVLDRTRASLGRSRELGTMEAGEDGVCRQERLPEGPVWLRVTPPEGKAAAEREVRLIDGETSSLVLHLSPIRVEGEVRKGEEPGDGYRIRIYPIKEQGATYFAEPVAETVTDDEGHYEATLWDEGLHGFRLADPAGRTADTERADVQGPITRVDFRMAAGDIEGVVVRPGGDPVAGATVSVRWEMGSSPSSAREVRSGADGIFRLPLERAAGGLQVTARHPGYEPDTVRLTLAEDVGPPTLVLTLRPDQLLHGRVVTAAGGPAAGVLVMSSGGRSSLGSEAPATSDGKGRFDVTRSTGGPTRLYATGPGCPLMTERVPAEAPEPVVLTCAPESGTLQLQFVNPDGEPVSGVSVALRRGGDIFPSEVLGGHLYSLGQATASDGSGRLVVPGLSPGTYEIEFGGVSTEAVGFSGYAGSMAVLPGQVRELKVVVQRGRTP